MTIGRAAVSVLVRTCLSVGPWVVVACGLLWWAEASGRIDLGLSLWPLPMLFALLGLAHEYGHLLAIAVLRGRVLAVEAPFGSPAVCIVYEAPSRRRELGAVLAGPALAASAGIVFGCLAVPSIVGGFAILGGLGHLLSLAAPVGDGLAIRQLLTVPNGMNGQS